MSLTETRPEKAKACSIAVGEMRNALATVAAEHELNIAEAINAAAQVFTSCLVGAYRGKKLATSTAIKSRREIRSHHPLAENDCGTC